MDLASSTVGHMYPSPAHRRSCTTQSDPVKPGPDFKEDNTIMAMSPQRMPQSCQPLTDQSSRSLVQYRSSQQQSDSYTPSEPLAYLGSPLPSQLVARQQVWAASPVSGWAGEAPDHAFVDTGTPRGLPWNNYDQAGVQTWVSPQHYQPTVSRGNTTYQQRLYRPTAEQNHYYSQREPCITTDNAPYYSYHSMSPTVTHAAEYPIEGYAGTSGPPAQGLAPYRRSHNDLPSSPPTGGRSLALMPDHSQSSGRPASQDEAHHMQSPTTPSSDFSNGRGGAHYAETVPESLSPSASEDKRAHGVPACSNKSAETPYAQLIYQAFMSSPRRALKLQDIYQWFLENTDKGQPGQGKGWQNSIRHNLSMNGAFERRPVKGEANDGGEEDCTSPSGATKQATEWVLQDWAIRQGVQSTTRYRNAARRNQNKKLRGKSRADASSRRPSRRRASSRSSMHAHSLPPLSRYDLRDYQYHGYYGQYPPQFDSPAEQLERLSLAPMVDDQRRAMYFTGGSDYEHAEYHPTPALGSMTGTSMPSSYASAPLNYSTELFMPSVPGAPTVASEDDVNEVITPEASFSILEPTVLLPGDNSTTHPGPTSDPYSGGGVSAYYSSATTGDSGTVIPRYTIGDVAGVCDEDNMSRSCGWDVNQHSRQ